jgi:predicted O-methyltransferase YrrM
LGDKYIQLTSDLHDYLVRVSVRESDSLKQLRIETEQLPESVMQISPEQGQFMGFLVRLMGVQRAIEVGVFTGYSSICLATALPEEGKLTACDVNEEWTKTAIRYWGKAGVADKIELVLGPAEITLSQLIETGCSGSYDFAFVDADKENYGVYYELVMELIRPGGLILFDNTLWSGKVIDESVTDSDTLAIRSLNQQLIRDDRVDLSMLPIGDGLTLVHKR